VVTKTRVHDLHRQPFSMTKERLNQVMRLRGRHFKRRAADKANLRMILSGRRGLQTHPNQGRSTFLLASHTAQTSGAIVMVMEVGLVAAPVEEVSIVVSEDRLACSPVSSRAREGVV
jgi:hypothetical protein